MRTVSEDKLGVCKQTRKFSADTLYTVLKKLLASKKPISEVMLRDAWLVALRKNKAIFPDGWYLPPPHGMIILFADDENIERFNYRSARKEETWPRNDIFLHKKNGIIFCYASPVDRKTGIIGDFGMTLYFGDNPDLKKLLQTTLSLEKAIFEYAQVGMTISDVSKFSEKEMNKYSMVNQIDSITDKTGTNSGHSIPISYEDWTSAEKKILMKGDRDWKSVAAMISKKRFFVNQAEAFVITEKTAFTIEPRPKVIAKPHLPASINYHTIAFFKENGEKELLTNFDNLFTLVGMDYMIEPMKKQKISYEQSGVNYEELDPAKTLAQKAGKETSKHLTNYGFEEMTATRGESAFVWKQKSTYMASVTESLGTKNLVADAMRKITGKTYYDVIGYDTIATALNDLTAVGAKPLVVTAFWAVGKSSWFNDLERTTDLVNGWKHACDDAQATWGGGESPSYNDIVNLDTIALGGSVVGIIPSKKRVLTDKRLKTGDRILLLKSTGINANGLSLTRAIAKKLPKGFGTKLPSGRLFGEAVLDKTNIYAKLIQDLLDAGIDLHYISNITGHGLRKLMRARGNFRYVVEKLFEPQEVFTFIQQQAGLSDYEIYETYNMGQDYAIFLPEKDVKKAQAIVKKNKFVSLDAGYITKGNKQVVIKPKDIVYKGETLQVRL
ncbi:M24 family metallopeptidase [Candidatus Microgenomates bacterium]|nr:M24 family metallopeptidase [Candidatus Microgenomates bacterium]